MEGLIPGFRNGIERGTVDNLTGGVYSGQIPKGDASLLLKLDFPIGNFDVIDIALFYNYRAVRFVVSLIENNTYIQKISDHKSKGNQTFFLYRRTISGESDSCELYIEFPLGPTILHSYSIKRLISQVPKAGVGRVIETTIDTSSFKKYTI